MENFENKWKVLKNKWKFGKINENFEKRNEFLWTKIHLLFSLVVVKNPESAINQKDQYITLKELFQVGVIETVFLVELNRITLVINSNLKYLSKVSEYWAV